MMVLARLGPRDGDDEDGEEQARHRHDHVHRPHDDDVDDRAVNAADSPSVDADNERDAHHREADEERQARAVDEPRKHVAADVVGAEQEARRAALLPDRRNADGIAELLDRRVGRNEIRRERRRR